MPAVPPHSHRQTRSAGVADHGALEGLEDDDHPQYLKPDEVLAGPNVSVDTTTTPGSVIITSSGGSGGGGVTDHGMLTGLTPDDDHPQYLTNARGDTRYDSKGAATAAVSAHAGAADPHPVYLTSAEGNAAYDAAGAATSAVAGHVAAADPHPVYLTQTEGDTRYVNTATDVMTGLLTVPDLKISGKGPKSGLVWTAGDTAGVGSWQEPSSLVVAEVSDPILINWLDQSAEGWVKYSGSGTMAWVEINSPSMPGALDCNGYLFAEWQAAEPMVFEPGALYRMTVRARMDAAALLSFGFQGYDPNTPATVVDIANGATTTNPHWCAVSLTAGDDAWVDDVTKPGKWLAWTGYLSGKTDGVAEDVPVVGAVAPAEAAVKMAAGVHQWRPVFRTSSGRVWIDAIEVHRLDRSLELPGGIRATDVYAQAVSATTVTTENLIIPPSTPGHLLTATDDAGGSDWLPMPVTTSEGPPTEAPDSPLTINLGTSYGKHCGTAYVVTAGTTITTTIATTRVAGSKAIQFALAVPAMVSIGLTCSLQQSASSNALIYAGIGVEDEVGTFLYTDDWSGATTNAFLGAQAFRASTGGQVTINGTLGRWRRRLQPGTYQAWPRAWLTSLDAASTKMISTGYLEIEIDPDMTYLTGQRS